MVIRNAPPVTRYDYAAMPQGPPYFQVIEGELIMSPAPGYFHQNIVLNLAVILRQYLAKNPLGEVAMAPLDVFLDDTNVVQPDLIFISKAHKSRITSQGIEGAPDLVVEVLSPSTALYDEGAKRKVYARAGVQELWLVNPDDKTVAVYRLAEDAECPARHAANAVFKSPLLPGLKIKTAQIFKSALAK
jgi:Uma2 family endonuclease